jgi:hypothetical protein
MSPERTTFYLPQSSGVAAMILLSFLAVADAACFGLVIAGAADRPGALTYLYGAAVLALLARIPATILFIVWAVRSRKNLDAFGAVDLEYSTGFLWYFIVPLLNLFVPLLAFQEIWRESEPVPKAEQRNSKVIYLWWIALVCSGLAATIPKLLSDVDRTQAERGLAPLTYASSCAAACLAVTMIWRLLERQRRHPRGGAVDAQ